MTTAAVNKKRKKAPVQLHVLADENESDEGFITNMEMLEYPPSARRLAPAAVD